MTDQNLIKRRQFLKKSALGVIGAGMFSRASLAVDSQETSTETDKAPLKIHGYRILGRTGFKVSDIATGSIQEENILNAMLEAGVNYIDTAEQYPGHHKMIGNVLKNGGHDRKNLFITSKMEVLEDKSKEGFIRRVHKGLEEMRTDYFDCMMMHMPERAETIKTEGFHEAMRQLKAEGRVRFVGISNHGSFWFRDPEETMEKVLLAAADDGRFDVFLMAYNFLQMDQAEKVLNVCKEKQIGTALMKTTPITKFYLIKSRVEQMEKEGKEVHPLYKEGLVRFKDKLDKAEGFINKYNLQNPEEIKEAAIRFVLDNPNVNTVCCSAGNFEEMERFIRLSGTSLTDWDRAKLSTYEEGCGELYCRHACGVCEPECPHGVPVNTIMRYSHYFISQGREREAMKNYASIPGNSAEVCQQCSGYCEQACPYNVPIQGMLIMTHNLLAMA
jgi:predicted aldo/keto reductase-like oxidoreductase